MANTIKLKRGTSTPTTSDLSNGEVGLDTSAKKLFVNDNGTIKEIGGVTSPNFIYLELRNASNNGAASYPNNDFTLVIAGTTTAQTVGAANQLLVSVSGVIQQPNSGTSTSGITGFIVDGNRFKTATNLPSAPDFIIFQKAGGIGEPSDGSVTSAKLSSSINSQITANTAKVTNATHTGEVTGSTALTIADNVVDEANLKVSNSPTNGYFLSAQSGNTGGLTWAEVTSDLVGDSSPQLGGDLDSNGNNITLGDNDRIRLGAGNRLDIYHDSSSGNSFIKETGSGSLVINANDFFVQNVATETMIKAASDGAVELYYDNTKMLETYSNGVKIHQGANSHLWLNDNANLRLGTGNDLRLFHDGSDSYIDETGTGDLKIRSSSGIQLQKDSEKYLACIPDGAVELYHDNSKKFETYQYGVNVSGTAKIESGGNFHAFDNVKFIAGTGEDLQIYHSGSNAFIKNTTNGNLYIQDDVGQNIYIRAKPNENAAVFKPDGAVELFHNNNKKFETTSGGINITGALTVNGSALSTGKVLQVISTNKTDTFSASIGKQSFSGAAISVTITPSNSSNKILLIAKLTIGLQSDNDIGFAFFKGGSVISGATADASGSAARLHAQTFSTGNEQQHNVVGVYLDAAGSTSAITYDCRLRHGNNNTGGHTIYLNRDHSNNTGDMEQNSMSTLTAIEVAA